MTNLKTHIVFKTFTIVLVLTFLAPTFVKFNHVFETHHHEVCYGEKTAHLHTADVDCEFYKFQLNQHFTIPVFTTKLPLVQENHSLIPRQYYFLSTFQQLHFSLRGPPSVI